MERDSRVLCWSQKGSTHWWVNFFFCQINTQIFHHFTEFVLYDLNRTVNEEIGREVFDYFDTPDNVENLVVISFKNVSMHIKLSEKLLKISLFRVRGSRSNSNIKQGSKVHYEFYVYWNIDSFCSTESCQRFSLDLCAEEKLYLEQRRPKVLDGLSAFLHNEQDKPQSLSEVFLKS